MGGAVPAGGRMMPGLPRPDRPKSSSWKNHSRSGRMIPGLSAQDDGQDDAKNRPKLLKNLGNQTVLKNCPKLSKGWQVIAKGLAVATQDDSRIASCWTKIGNVGTWSKAIAFGNLRPGPRARMTPGYFIG